MGKRRITPSKLTKASVDAICEMVKQGVPQNIACSKLGIERTTLYKWLREYETFEDDGKDTVRYRLLRILYCGLEQAKASFCQRCIAQIQIIGSDDWRAWAFLVERRFPDEFAEHSTVDATVTQSPMLDALTKGAQLAGGGDAEGDS